MLLMILLALFTSLRLAEAQLCSRHCMKDRHSLFDWLMQVPAEWHGQLGRAW